MTIVKGFKGFDKDFKCRGFQFAVGETYEEPTASLCNRGFHFCEYPLDVLKYYPPAGSRFCTVDSDCASEETHALDTERATTTLRIGAETDIAGLVSAAVEYTMSRTNLVEGCSASGTQGVAQESGYQGVAQASGTRGVATPAAPRPGGHGDHNKSMETTMEVTLLAMTPNAQELIFAAMRGCYSENTPEALIAQAVGGNAGCARLIQDVLESGHTSPLEHVSFTFSVSGVSRALTHQLVRHRIASYSQQSQRYVKAENFDFVTPQSVLNRVKDGAVFKFDHAMAVLHQIYTQLTEMGVPAEDARYVLPNAACTNITVTMNCRSLLNFFGERCCNRAQWEIRDMANRMLAICTEHLPVVFQGRGAKCLPFGECPESEKFACGKFPVRQRKGVAGCAA